MNYRFVYDRITCGHFIISSLNAFIPAAVAAAAALAFSFSACLCRNVLWLVLTG